MYNSPAGNDIAVVLQAMQDNPLSRFTMKPELSIPKPPSGWPAYAEQIGWRATWEQVDSQSGGMIAWELFSTGKTPQECLQQFSQDLNNAFNSQEDINDACNTCGYSVTSYEHYTQCAPKPDRFPHFGA
jgi:hypothetical protein